MALEGQSSFYRKRHDDRYESLNVQLVPIAIQQANVFRFQKRADQDNRSNTKLSLIAPNNPTSTNVHLSFVSTQRKLSLISLQLMHVGILQL